ncbi:MAG TPA: hypothetical protein VFH08_12560, partial [Chitinophagaceae bacterium]|nr:hypothetical protein [Chitinophagaceae bacterium]
MLRIKSISYSLLLSLVVNAQEYEYNYTFFTNSNMNGSYFSSQTFESGGSTIANVKGKLPILEYDSHTPGNLLKLQYKNAPGGKWSAAIFYREKRGMDHFKKANTLSLWMIIRSYAGITNELPRVQLMRRDSSLSASFKIKTTLSAKWRQVNIPLKVLIHDSNFNPRNFIAVVFSYENGKENKEHLLFIDDIEFTNTEDTGKITTQPLITSVSNEYANHIDITWDKITDKNIRFVKIYRLDGDGRHIWFSGLQESYINRFTDFVGETGRKHYYTISFLDKNYKETKRSKLVPGSTRAMTDDELLTMVQQASFRYYWEAAETTSGLPKENIHGRQNMIAAGASGFGIMALIVGTERKFISRKESVDRFIRILNFLEKADRFHGVYPHFLDGPTGKVEPFFGSGDNGADLVETSFLLQGLLTARQYFSSDDPQEKMIRDRITAIWEGTEWDWFKRYRDSKFLYWHWSPDQA